MTLLRILIDAGVPKDSLMASSIYLKLKKSSHEPIVTARDYESTPKLFEYFDIPYFLVGKHGGKTLKGKLLADLKRALELTKVISDLGAIDLIIHFANPAIARVAFGLGIPQIVLEDTPHATAVHKLTFPLATYAITPKCLPRDLFIHFMEPERLIQYDGVDPIEWITTFKPDKKFLDDLSIDRNKRIVVLRPAETFAYYYLEYSKGSPLLYETEIIGTIFKYFPDTQLIVVPRYAEQKKILRKKFGKKIIIPKSYIPLFNIIAFSDIILTGGGTIVEEGGLYGVPSIYYFPKKLNYAEYLHEKGLPVFHIPNLQMLLNSIINILKDPDEYKVDPSPIVSKLEKPSDKLLEIINKIK